MLKTLGRETKGFRLVSVLTPIFMIAEVIMEMIQAVQEGDLNG